jgi:hypothetical protein
LPDAEPKIPILVNFGAPWNGQCWYILWPFGHMPFGRASLWLFGIFSPFLVCFTKENLATLGINIISDLRQLKAFGKVQTWLLALFSAFS